MRIRTHARTHSYGCVLWDIVTGGSANAAPTDDGGGGQFFCFNSAGNRRPPRCVLCSPLSPHECMHVPSSLRAMAATTCARWPS